MCLHPYGIIVVDSDEQMNSILESVGSDNVSGGALYFYNRIEDKITKAEPQGAYGFTKTEQTKNAPYSFTISNDEEQVKNFYVLQSFDFAEQGKLPDGTSVTLSETENEGLILKQLPMNGYSQLYYFYCSDLVSVEDARSLTADEIMQYQITPHTLPSFFSIVDGAVATIEGDSPNYRFDSHENMFIDPHTGEQYHGTVNWMMYVYDIIHNLDYEGMVSDNNGERVFNPALQDSEYYIYSDGQWYNMDDLGSGDDTYYLWQRSSNTTWAELPENVNYVISRYQGETPSAELAAGFCTLHYFKNLTDVSNLHVGDTLEMSVFGQGLDTFTITVDMVGDGWFRAQYGLNYNYYKRTGSCTNTFAHYDAIKWIPTLKWLESTEDGTFNPPFNYDGFNGAYFHKAMNSSSLIIPSVPAEIK